MSKGSGWVPIDKSLVDVLSKLNRPFSAIEAMLSLTVDIDYGKQWTYRGYAKQWQWSVGKVKRFVDCSMNSNGTVVEQKGNGSGTLVHFIDKGLWELDEQLVNSNETVDEQLPETTIYPNPNPKEKQCAEKSISQPRIPYKKIISYLNKKAGSEFSHTTSATKRFIKARWNEGHREKDFCTVIENKCSEWRTNPDMIQYLRPQTLFGTKFESYLQQKNSKKQQNRCGQCAYNQRDPCKNLSEKSFDPNKCTAFSHFEK